MKISLYTIEKIKDTMCFKKKNKKNIGSATTSMNNCQHFYDHTAVQTPPPSWNNIHGFKTLDGYYWAGCDMRSWGIRVQDILVKCSTKEKADYWIGLMQSSNKVIDTIKTRDGHKSGSQVDTKFTFYCTDGSDKSFNMTGSSDFYYEDI